MVNSSPHWTRKRNHRMTLQDFEAVLVPNVVCPVVLIDVLDLAALRHIQSLRSDRKSRIERFLHGVKL